MDIHKVALKVFASIAATDNQRGLSETDRDALAARAYQYAEAFLKAKDGWDGSHSRKATVAPLKV